MGDASSVLGPTSTFGEALLWRGHVQHALSGRRRFEGCVANSHDGLMYHCLGRRSSKTGQWLGRVIDRSQTTMAFARTGTNLREFWRNRCRMRGVFALYPRLGRKAQCPPQGRPPNGLPDQFPPPAAASIISPPGGGDGPGGTQQPSLPWTLQEGRSWIPPCRWWTLSAK